MSSIISVVGATGHQGGGVVNVLLDSTDYRVRALTSNPSSNKAKALLQKYSKFVDEGRFELVEGNLNDQASLEKAIKGSYGLYASFSPTPSEGPTEENPEYLQGKNLVDAAKASDIQHFVYSSLPSLKSLTNGKVTEVFPFETKAAVEQYARAHLPNTTIVIPGSFYSNLNLPLWAKRRDDGVVVITTPLSSSTKVGWVDEAFDMGTFVAAILKKGPQATAGKTYPINSTPITCAELAETYAQVTGERAEVDPLTLDTVSQILTSVAGQTFATALVDMLKFLDSVDPSPYTYGPGYIEHDTSYEDLGVKASTLESFLKRTGYRLPASA
ncbi:NmrA/HSCARG family protein [Sporobolomyces koalae]|uniref:NmrA/HSCARG family protein n=1 Tax=Sporobolomyces koalae TaxID=500713 RepID=UPI00316D598F